MNPLLSKNQILSSYPPDILFSIAKQLPYQDILTLCKVSKRFNDLFSLKNYNNLWRYLYLRDISSDPLPLGTDYYNIYRKIRKETRGLPSYQLLDYASWNGYINLVQKNLEKGAPDYNYNYNYNMVLVRASGGGHIDIVKMMLNLGATDYSVALACASLGGHLNIVKMMLDLGANNYNEALSWASYGGHLNIVKLMLDLGATDYDWARSYASLGGHLNIVDYIKEYQNLHSHT